MATHDYNIANQTGANFRADLNNALAAIVSNNYGSTDPATVLDAGINGQCQWWADSATGLLKLRNTGDTDWVVVGTLDATGLGIGLTASTAVTISGTPTSVEFTSIPAWVKRITVLLSNVSLSGADQLLLQLGTSSGYITTGYVSTVVRALGSTKEVDAVSSTSGFIVGGSNGAYESSGSVSVSNITGTIWTSSGTLRASTSTAHFSAGTSGSLGGALTQIKLLTTGTNTFDNGGIVNIMYEG